MIYVTGDTHGERTRIAFIEKSSHIGKGDFLIVCGDFGFIFKDDEDEKNFLDLLETRKYTILFVDGNHENFDAIYRYPIEDWNGGKVHRIRKNILYLMRGQVFEIEGKKFFTMGGAYSIDRFMRKCGVSYWTQELPNNDEYTEAVSNLKKHNKRVDYIITHTAPREIILREGIVPNEHDGELTGFLEYIMYEMDYTHWYCGHWHFDEDFSDNFSFLYFDIKRIE